MISRTSCAQRHQTAIRAAHATASSRQETSMIENPPTTALVSDTGPAVTVPSGATMVDCWRWTPPPKIQTPAAFASRTTACDASPTDGQSSSGTWSIAPSSKEIKYRGIVSYLWSNVEVDAPWDAAGFARHHAASALNARLGPHATRCRSPSPKP